MDNIYTIIVIILMALAVLDLVVGVSNDAANFLNSAIGSKVAPRYVILTVASIGIMVGSFFSSGMMEIARSGVMNPGMFAFKDIILLFLAVMITDVILLDVFNSLGLPTSTTVSLIFELLGAAVTIALIVISQTDGAHVASLSQYINSSKALVIISGIFVSVGIAFVCGVVVMFATRMLFTFHYKKTYQIFGPLWCGVAFTAISYFAIFKGLKDSSILDPETIKHLGDNIPAFLAAMFLGWTAVSALLQYVFRVNTLKITVLAGTFALALAFAGNDLVNFIGVFMAGFDAYNIASSTGDVNMLMGDLAKPVVANTGILLAAGVIMSLTLWFSKKARAVTDTEVNLARQDNGVERFGSTSLSRAIVRTALTVNKKYERSTPEYVQNFISRRFRMVYLKNEDRAHFDLIRATVNLTVAAMLISMATSLKLPLSTTYVTFMVAMGSSLADRAWGRESAVYRITGVLTVVSGWFLTAFIAFGVASLVACALMWGGRIGLAAMILLCGLILIQTTRAYRKKNKNKKQPIHEYMSNANIIDVCASDIRETMKKVLSIYNQTLVGMFNEDRKLLRQMLRESEDIYSQAHDRKYEVFPRLKELQDNYVFTGHYYVQVVDYLDEVTKSLLHICRPCFEHINNNHEGLNKHQMDDMMSINAEVEAIYDNIIDMLETNDFERFDNILVMRDKLFETITNAIMNQIRRTKKGQSSTKNGMLYLGVINETKTMVLQSRNLLKAQMFFVSNVQE